MDDTILVWTDRHERLEEFLVLLNGISVTIKFTMEAEQAALSFLDFFVYKKGDGSLGR